MYSNAGQLVYRKVNGVHTDYYYLGKKLVAKKKGSTKTYIHSDFLGSPAAESNTLGTVTSRLHYQPFGDTIEAAREEVGYTGHKFDKDLGLSYMQARYYDPVVGLFMSNDPVGFRDVHSFNRYAYANNNPYKYVDPDGKESIRFSRPNLSTMMYEMFGYKTRDEANKNFSKDVASASKKVAVDATVGTLKVVAYNANGIAKAAGNGALIPSPVSPFLAKVSGGATVISAVADGALDLMDDQIPREGVRDLVAVVIAQQVEKIALRRGASHEVAASIEVGAKKIVQSVMKAESMGSE